jgi:hypothetical protein
MTSLYLTAAGMDHLQRRSLIEPRWKINLLSENVSSGEPVREGNRRVIVDRNKPVPALRKLSDSNNVGNTVMEVSDEISDSRTGGFKMPSQPKLLISSKVHMTVQDIQQSGTDTKPSSGSPTPFQSLDATNSSYVHQSLGDNFSHFNVQVLHPSINNLSFTGGLGVETKSSFPGK